MPVAAIDDNELLMKLKPAADDPTTPPELAGEFKRLDRQHRLRRRSSAKPARLFIRNLLKSQVEKQHSQSQGRGWKRAVTDPMMEVSTVQNNLGSTQE